MRLPILVAGLAIALVAMPTNAVAQCSMNPTSGAAGPGGTGPTALTGCADPFQFGSGSNHVVQFDYLGASAGFWHSMWAFTSVSGTPAAPPFAAGNPVGQLILCKNDDCGAAANPLYAVSGNTEMILGLYVLTSGNASATGYTSSLDGYWLFSGLLSRNPDGQAHIRYFSDLVKADNRSTTIATLPADYSFLLGWEDKCDDTMKVAGTAQYLCSGDSDWDFNDNVFAMRVSSTPISTETVPEPATMTLLATGLAGMAAARRRRRQA